ncbi:hypothetical protein [Ruegeria arenilitoris]|uniref:hypothetical protein n=1 Tax=Ruegeria arenilitoris TaxID=1173585 RepID=UPI0014803BBA|nr:hypothetical protein [Ruegeria arenilitoris]
MRPRAQTQATTRPRMYSMTADAAQQGTRHIRNAQHDLRDALTALEKAPRLGEARDLVRAADKALGEALARLSRPSGR